MADLRNIEITQEIAAKVLSVVDAGLVSGVGEPVPGKMCVEAAVCFALGLPHSDDPQCVSRAVRSLKIRLNDSNWSTDKARAQGLRRLAIAQLGTRDKIDDKEFAKRVAELAIKKYVPAALRAAASIQKSVEHKDALLKAASRCEIEASGQSARDARNAANAAAANAAAEAAAYAAYAAAYAADAAAVAADAAADAADAAADAADAKKAARDKSLAGFAEEVVQILIDMKAPGAAFLNLTEAAQ
jgi:hypothetical protein